MAETVSGVRVRVGAEDKPGALTQFGQEGVSPAGGAGEDIAEDEGGNRPEVWSGTGAEFGSGTAAEAAVGAWLEAASAAAGGEDGAEAAGKRLHFY